MKTLNEKTLKQMEASIKKAEAKSDCEIVAVFARRSSDYHFIPSLWAALAALTLPAVAYMLFPLPDVSVVSYAFLQASLFMVLTFVLRVEPLLMHLIPKKIHKSRAERMAALQFISNGLNDSDAPPAVLFFISFTERYVRILTSAKVPVPNEKWQEVVDEMIEKIRVGDTEKGMVEAIGAVGDILEKACPRTEEHENRFPNRLILL